jgi:hypothetical protein
MLIIFLMMSFYLIINKMSRYYNTELWIVKRKNEDTPNIIDERRQPKIQNYINEKHIQKSKEISIFIIFFSMFSTNKIAIFS